MRRVTDEQDDDEEDVLDPENQPRSAFDIFSDFDDEHYLYKKFSFFYL